MNWKINNHEKKRKNDNLTLQPSPVESWKGKFEIWNWFLQVLKMPVIPLLPNAPHQTVRDSHPNSTIPMSPKLSLLASQQLLHHLRHNPMNAKQSKHHRPQIKSKGAMDKEVVYWFPIPSTHTTPIQNQNLPFPKIINSQNIPKAAVQPKKQLWKGP